MRLPASVDSQGDCKGLLVPDSKISADPTLATIKVKFLQFSIEVTADVRPLQYVTLHFAARAFRSSLDSNNFSALQAGVFACEAAGRTSSHRSRFASRAIPPRLLDNGLCDSACVTLEPRVDIRDLRERMAMLIRVSDLNMA
jgi:hypothetical protein